MILRSCLTFAAALAALPALAAEPAAVEGDAFERLGVALALAERCETMRGFEYLYLAEAWQRHEGGSAAGSAGDAARKAAADSGQSWREANMAAFEARKRHADAWRAKAERLGCDGGHNYLVQGMVLSYKNLGSVMAIAVAYRGPGAGAESPFSPLKPNEAAAIGAFNDQATAFFGDEKAQFDAMLPQLAQERMSGYPTYNEAGLRSAILDDQQQAFTIIHHEALANNAQWAVRGATIADGTPFGYRTMRLSKDGAPTLSLIAAPKEVSILGGPKAVRTYLAIGVRADGTVIAGLGGGEFDGAPATVTVKAEVRDDPVKRVATGQPATEGCPYARCFAFPREAIASLASGTGKAYFYAAPDAATASFAVTRLDGTDIEQLRLKVATTRP